MSSSIFTVLLCGHGVGICLTACFVSSTGSGRVQSVVLVSLHGVVKTAELNHRFRHHILLVISTDCQAIDTILRVPPHEYLLLLLPFPPPLFSKGGQIESIGWRLF